jgi:signal transduction histidine kinase
VAGLWITVTPEGSEGRWGQVALASLAVAGMLLSRRWPVTAVVLVGVATAAAWMLGLTADPFVLAGFTLFAVAERQGLRRFPWWMAAGAAVLLIASLGLDAEGVEDRFRGLLLSTVIMSASWMLGVRTRQVQVEAAARSRAEERLRLARDVHDVLSHSLGTIGVQAGVAAHVSSLSEDDLRVLLRDIEGDARNSLKELKELLQRERADTADVGRDVAPTSLRLTALLGDIGQSAERAGLRARLDVAGVVDALPAAVRSTVHRVVQEAVTNVIRHASASSLVIGVRVSDDGVTIEVRDDGLGATHGLREGYGLTGMRERIALVGGTLSITATARGFSVAATLPLAISLPGDES